MIMHSVIEIECLMSIIEIDANRNELTSKQYVMNLKNIMKDK